MVADQLEPDKIISLEKVKIMFLTMQQVIPPISLSILPAVVLISKQGMMALKGLH